MTTPITETGGMPTQADANAAADLVEQYFSDNRPMLALARSMRAGHMHGPFPAAFARHREASTAELVEALRAMLHARVVRDGDVIDRAKALLAQHEGSAS